MNELSIVIPVYNGEQHIKKCYDTINKQTIKNLEIIFVNDGSTDNTANILQSLKEVDDRIIVYNQQNKGVSAARNRGIDLCTKKYITFLDADDLIKVDFYETLLKNIGDNDLIISNLLLERDNEFIEKESVFEYNKTYTKKYIQKDILKHLLCIEDLTLIPVVNKIYKREYIVSENIRFVEGICLEEDGIFNTMVLSKVNSLVFINYAGYFYINNEQSVTRNFIENEIFEKNIIKYNFNYLDYIDLKFSPLELKQFKSSRFIFALTFLIYKTLFSKKINDDEKYKYIHKIISNIDSINASNNLHVYYIEKLSLFEKFVIKLIKNQSSFYIKLIISLFNILNSEKIIKFLRRINKFKMGKPKSTSMKKIVE